MTYLVTRTNELGTIISSQAYETIGNALEYYRAVVKNPLTYAFTATLYVEDCAINQTTVEPHKETFTVKATAFGGRVQTKRFDSLPKAHAFMKRLDRMTVVRFVSITHPQRGTIYSQPTQHALADMLLGVAGGMCLVEDANGKQLLSEPALTLYQSRLDVITYVYARYGVRCAE